MGKRCIDAFGDGTPDARLGDNTTSQRIARSDGAEALSQVKSGAEAETSFEAELNAALADGRISHARSLVANAEAVLFNGAGTLQSGKPAAAAPGFSRADVAWAKARVALATGDTVAAHAILVQGIERYPDSPSLRALMAESMFATGRATDIRPVLHHLAREPSIRDAPAGGSTAVKATEAKG